MFNIRETRAYSTKQRPNRVTMHGPYATREEAFEALSVLARKAERNDNRSNWQIEEDVT